MIETRTRRREIDEVASELFNANGYAATSVRDIARALDIQGASFYAHVASKEDVLLVDRRLDRVGVRGAARTRPSATRPDRRPDRPVRRPRRGPRARW